MIIQVDNCVSELRFKGLECMNKKAIKCKVRVEDNRFWKQELATLSNVGIYMDWKKGVRKERCYNNAEASIILFRARSNTLKLNINNRHRRGEGVTICDIYGVGDEDLGHFLLKYQKLEGKREKELFGNGKDEDEVIIGRFSFSRERIRK